MPARGEIVEMDVVWSGGELLPPRQSTGWVFGNEPDDVAGLWEIARRGHKKHLTRKTKKHTKSKQTCKRRQVLVRGPKPWWPRGWQG